MKLKRQNSKNAPELELVEDRRLSGGVETDLVVLLVEKRRRDFCFFVVRKFKKKRFDRWCFSFFALSFVAAIEKEEEEKNCQEREERRENIARSLSFYGTNPFVLFTGAPSRDVARSLDAEKEAREREKQGGAPSSFFFSSQRERERKESGASEDTDASLSSRSLSTAVGVDTQKSAVVSARSIPIPDVPRTRASPSSPSGV